MTREAELEAILAHGRRTRRRASRGLWLVAAVVGVVCLVGFAIAMLGEPGVATTPPRVAAPARGGGLGIGLAIGACAGIVIGFAIGRQRATHSSRNKP